MFSPGESYRHFMAKSALFWSLRRLGHEVRTEVDVVGRPTSPTAPRLIFGKSVGCGVADVLDLTTHVHYEIEASHMPSQWRKKVEQYRREGWEIIVIPIHKAPSDLDGMLDYVQQFIQPD